MVTGNYFAYKEYWNKRMGRSMEARKGYKVTETDIANTRRPTKIRREKNTVD